jgi:hypothetical protein
VEPDLWGHIQYGEDWLYSGTLPRTATHTYTASGYPWINHENLFELSVALGQRAVGGAGLMILKTLAGLAVMLLMLRRTVRFQIPLVSAAVCLLPAAMCLAEFWLMRPQLFSFIFFAAATCVDRKSLCGLAGGQGTAISVALAVPATDGALDKFARRSAGGVMCFSGFAGIAVHRGIPGTACRCNSCIDASGRALHAGGWDIVCESVWLGAAVLVCSVPESAPSGGF